MKTSEQDFEKWLNTNGYDYETHVGSFVLYCEFVDSQNEDALDLIDTFNRFETKEEIDEAIRQQNVEINALRHEYMFWKLENFQRFNKNVESVELFYHFLKYRENNN